MFILQENHIYQQEKTYLEEIYGHANIVDILKGNKILKYCNMKLLNKPKKPSLLELKLNTISDLIIESWDRWIRKD